MARSVLDATAAECALSPLVDKSRLVAHDVWQAKSPMIIKRRAKHAAINAYNELVSRERAHRALVQSASTGPPAIHGHAFALPFNMLQ